MKPAHRRNWSTGVLKVSDGALQFAAFPDYTSATDTPEDAGMYELPLQPGDVIVAATDGLWDNVHQQEIVDLLPSHADRMPEVRPFTRCGLETTFSSR